MGTTDTIAGYRIIMEALAGTINEEHGTEAAVSLLLAAACVQGVNAGMAAADIQRLNDEGMRRYREAGFPAAALIAGQRSVN